MSSFKVSVVTQIKKVLEQEAGYLRLRTSEGDIGILPNHASYVAELAMGKMEIESPEKDKRDVYFLSGGFIEFSNNQATVIADEILPIEKIDIETEQTKIEELKKQLEKISVEEEKVRIQKKIKVSLKKQEATMKFHFLHQNFNVLDLEKSIKFYDEALGLKVVREKNAKDESYKIVYLGDGITNFQLELTWLADRKEKYDLGDEEFHLAFEVDNYEEAFKKHKKMNCVVFVNEKMGIYFITDPDGYWLEILPPKK